MNTGPRRTFKGVLVCFLLISIGAAFSLAQEPEAATERLEKAIAEQAKLVTALRAEFHRLKYEKIPYPYAKLLVDIESLVEQIGDNATTIEQKIVPGLGLCLPTEQADNSGQSKGDSMTVNELVAWINGHNTPIKKRVAATIGMFPYLSDLTPMNLEKLAYEVTSNPNWDYESQRLEIIEAGKEFLAQQ